MWGKSVKSALSEMAESEFKPYANAAIGLLVVIAGSLVLIALGVWGGAGR